MKRAAMVLALFLASAAFADGAMHVWPLGPTTAMPIEVHYRTVCTNKGHAIQPPQNGLIRIHVVEPVCVAGSEPRIETVQLPVPLAAGEYRIEVRLMGSTNLIDTTTFVVRNAGPRGFEVHPFVVTAGIRVRLTGVPCAENLCDVRVRVGGQEVEHTFEDGAIWFDAPVRDEGLADVSVQIGDAIVLSPAALYYARGEDPSVFERVLFPVISSVDGSHGSRWRTEAAVSNPRPWYVLNGNSLGPVQPCIDGPCDALFAPKETKHLREGYPNGAVMYVPRPHADDFAFALRIRDESRVEDSLGSRVPVVRERDMFHGTDIHLLDVPLDPRYRVRVRVYMIEPVIATRDGAVVIPRGDARLAIPFSLEPAFGSRLYHAAVDLPQGAIGERVHVRIDMPLDATGWAFATVTNNETQQVTIVAPH